MADYSAPSVNELRKKGGSLSEKLCTEFADIATHMAAIAASKTGSDSAIVSGTAGTDGNFIKWNADGDAVDSNVADPGVAGKCVVQDMTSVAGISGTGTPVIAIGDLDGARASTAEANFVPLQVNIAQNADIGVGNTCAAGYVKTATGIAQTGQLATWLVRTALSHDVFDAYGVQTHLDINGAMSASAAGNLTAMSAKTDLNTYTVGAGQVMAGLFIIDGSTGAAVTSTDCDGVWINIESGVPSNTVDSLLRLGTGSTVNAGIRVTGTANVTNLFDFDAVSGCVSADTGTPGASTHKIKVDINGTAGYIAVYADY